MLIRPDPYADRWDYVLESNQQAFINYQNGVQKMLISISLSEDSDGSLWLFPIPAEPEDISLDVVTELPDLNGENIQDLAEREVDTIKGFFYLSQIYSINYAIREFIGSSHHSKSGYLSGGPVVGGDFFGDNGLEQDVVVHEHIDKEGITSEIITAKTGEALYEYLRDKEFKIKEGSIAVLDQYIGEEYSFVTSWKETSSKNSGVLSSIDDIFYQRNSVPQKRSVQRGLFVTFPTNKIYFPLLPTSVYGASVIPISLRIVGHVSPKIFNDIKPFVKTEYYLDKFVSLDSDLMAFYGGRRGSNLEYTKIEIKAPSNHFTDDLWINAREPLKANYLTFIYKYPLIFGILLFALISVAFSVMVGYVIFKDLRSDIKKLIMIGLSNFLTIIGLIVTVFFTRTKEKNEEADLIVLELKQKKYVKKRKLAVPVFLIDIPLMLLSILILSTVTFGLVPVVPVGVIFLLLPFLFSLAILILYLILIRIRPEDKVIFDRLKSYGYSTWAFTPKDVRKIFFVPIFSVLFVILVYGIKDFIFF